MARVVGDAPGCPWAAFYDREVAAVMRAHRWFAKGQAREWWGDDPEWWLVEGVSVFAAALDAAQADVVATKAKRRG